MKRTLTRTAIGAIAMSLALLVAACGTSGGNDDAKDTTTTEADKTTTAPDDDTTTTAEDGGEDGDAQARADSVSLTEDDFPSGWTASPSSSSDESNGIEECDPSFGDTSDELATNKNDEFTQGDPDAGDGVHFGLETKVFTDADAAEAAVAPFADDDVIACISDMFKDEFASDGTTIDGDLAADDGWPATTADDAYGISGQFTLTSADGQNTLSLTLMVLMLRTDDVASQVLILAVGENFDPTELADPITTVEELQAAA